MDLMCLHVLSLCGSVIHTHVGIVYVPHGFRVRGYDGMTNTHTLFALSPAHFCRYSCCIHSLTLTGSCL